MAAPERIIAQVMDIGDYEDVQTLASQLGDEMLRQVLTHAEAGQFSERSWAYWHYRLGLADLDQIPPLPVRRCFPVFPLRSLPHRKRFRTTKHLPQVLPWALRAVSGVWR